MMEFALLFKSGNKPDKGTIMKQLALGNSPGFLMLQARIQQGKLSIIRQIHDADGNTL